MTQGQHLPPILPVEQADPARGAVLTEFEDKTRLLDLEAPPPVPTPPAAPPPVPPPPAEPEFSEADKQEFVRCVLGDRPFRRQYLLFGSVAAVFSDLTVEQDDLLMTGLSDLCAAGRIAASDEAAWGTWKARWRLAGSLHSLTVQGQKREFPGPAAGADALLEVWRRLAGGPRPLCEALLRTSAEFERLTTGLTRHAGEPSFWAAGGRVSR